MRMGMIVCALAASGLATSVYAGITPVYPGGTVLFTDGFESYNATGAATNLDSAALDKNLTGGGNAAPNGSGNPWFGPYPANFYVVNGAETTAGDGTVTPKDGNQMVRGKTGSGHFDQDYMNLTTRVGGGTILSSANEPNGLELDWYFYDPAGSGANAGNYQDYIALANYSGIPTSGDYSGSGNALGNSVPQRLSLGANTSGIAALNSADYQARVVGAADGVDPTTTWFNLPITRSVGWHEGSIVVSPDFSTVSFYVDGTLGLTHALPSSPDGTNQFNSIEMNGTFGGPQIAYYDDVQLSTLPEPASMGLALGGIVVLARRRRRI